MRWLIDEMFPAEVAVALGERGHDAHAAVLSLRALTDGQLLDVAVAEERVLVTENVVDFVGLLQERVGGGDDVAPVVFVPKAGLPRDAGRLARVLAGRLDAWAGRHPEPFPTAYWL